MPDRGVCRLGHGAYSSVKSAPFWQGVGLCCSASLRCLPGPWQSLKVPAPVRQPRRVQDDAGPVALARAPPRAPAPARRPPIRRLPASKPACTTQCYTRSPNPAWNPTSVSLRLELHCHQGRGGAGAHVCRRARAGGLVRGRRRQAQQPLQVPPLVLRARPEVQHAARARSPPSAHASFVFSVFRLEGAFSCIPPSGSYLSMGKVGACSCRSMPALPKQVCSSA